MGTPADLLRGLQSLNVKSEAVNIINSQETIIVEKNQEQLTKLGVDKNNIRLAPYKSIEYANKKLLLNPAGVTDLKLTGDTYTAMYVKTDSNGFTIGSNDPKEAKLEQQYGKDIWGLTPESLSEYSNNEFLDSLKTYISKQTGLKFT